jgi:hypothetical protein
MPGLEGQIGEQEVLRTVPSIYPFIQQSVLYPVAAANSGFRSQRRCTRSGSVVSTFA